MRRALLQTFALLGAMLVAPPAAAGNLFVGASAGIEYRRRYDVVQENAHRGLEFSTTLALRYAYGRGTIYGLSLAPLAHANPLEGDTIPVQASIHEFQVHIGSALYF